MEENKWFNAPDMPIPKISPTLIAVKNRYVYHIGGLDFDNSIFMLDTLNPESW